MTLFSARKYPTGEKLQLEICVVLFLLLLFHSELEKYEDALTDYLKYKDFLFRLSPAEWQDEQKSKDSKTKTSSKQNDGQEPTETGIWNNNLALLWLIANLIVSAREMHFAE